MKKSIGRAFFWTCLGIALVFLHGKHVFNNDDGTILEWAWNLVNGRRLYNDFFELITPGSFYLLAGAWKIFGVSYWVARIVAIASLYMASVGAYKVSKIFYDGRATYLTPFLIVISSPQWPIITHNAFFLTLLIWSLYFFLKTRDPKKTMLDFWMSGILAGFAILFVQHKGLVLFVTCAGALALSLIKKPVHEGIRTFGSYVAGGVLVVSSLFIFWPLKVLYANLVLPLLRYPAIHQKYYGPFLLFSLVFVVTVYLLRKEKQDGLRLLLVLQGLLLIAIATNSALTSITFILLPTFVLVPLLIQRMLTVSWKEKVMPLIIYSLSFIMIVVSSTYSFLATPYNFSEHNFLPAAFDSNCPGKYIYAGPWLPQVYFEMRKLNATPYYILLSKFQTQEDFVIAEEKMIQNKPSCAIINYDLVRAFGYTGNHDNSFETYLWSAYQPTLRLGDGTFLMTRKETR